MRDVIVYYSLEGNTDFAARQIARALGARLVRLEPEKAYPDKGFAKFFWGGKSAVMAETPKLRPCAFAPEEADRVIFGTPVWAANFAPPLRTFIRENRDVLRGKRFAAFACQSGSGAERALARLRDCLGGVSFDAQAVLVDPKSKSAPESAEELRRFCERCRAAEP